MFKFRNQSMTDVFLITNCKKRKRNIYGTKADIEPKLNTTIRKARFIDILAALPRRRGVQLLRDCGSAYLTKLGNSHFATVTSQQSPCDCDSTYLTECGNSRFATVALHI